MESLALVVSIFFLLALVSGPVALLLNRCGLPVLAVVTALFSILLGAWWMSVAPFPVSLIGGFTAICGAVVISRY